MDEQDCCFLFTYPILVAVVVFGEGVTVSDDHFPAPHVQLAAHFQITILIKLVLDGSSLQECGNIGWEYVNMTF